MNCYATFVLNLYYIAIILPLLLSLLGWNSYFWGHLPEVQAILPKPSRRLATNSPVYSTPSFHRILPSPDMQSSRKVPL